MIELCQAGLGSAEYPSGDVATHQITAGKDMWDTTLRGYSSACIEYGALTINPGTARRSARGCPSQISRLQVPFLVISLNFMMLFTKLSL